MLKQEWDEDAVLAQREEIDKRAGEIIDLADWIRVQIMVPSG